MTNDPDIPPESGRRAHRLSNGEVHGSGAGTGGGNPGEDLDDDEHGGARAGATGAAAETKGTPAQGAGDRAESGL